MSKPANFRDTVRELRHDVIRDAAIAVLSEFGFRGASMKQIARQAGVSEGTIYNVFDDKLDLLISILDPLAERLTPGAPPPVPTKGALKARLAVFDDTTAAMMRVLLSEALIDEEVRRQFGARIIAPMTSRKPDATQYAALSLVLGAVMLRLLDQDDRRAEKAALEMIEALAAPGGRP